MMSGITGSMNLGASAMNAHSWGMAVTAHNVANVNTAGFAPQHAVYATGPGGRGVRLDAVLQDSGVAGRFPPRSAITRPYPPLRRLWSRTLLIPAARIWGVK